MLGESVLRGETNMSRIRVAMAGAVLALGTMPASSPAQSGFWHDFCMGQATNLCIEGDNLGYAYFSACGAAMYDICMEENGQPSGGGGDLFYRPPGPICHVAGRIEAGSITDPSTQCDN